MSSDWQLATIEEIAAPQPSALATGPFGSSISSKYFTTSGVPVIRGSNLSAEVSTRLLDEGLVFVSPEKAAEFQRSIARRGDLVFTCWGTINQVGFIDGHAKYDSYIVSNKQMKLTVDSTKVDPRFLYYVFSAPEKQKEILDNGIGSSVPGFNLGQLRRHEVLLPSLQGQVVIADFLESFDGRIAVLRETNATLEAIAQALFKSWFVDFDPVRAKQEGRAPDGMDEATAALFPDAFEESELGLVPRGWAARSLDSFADYLNGLALQKYPPESDDEYLPVIKIAQLRAGSTSGADRASSRLKPEYVVRDGDVLFSWSGTLEVELWCGGDGALNQHLFKVTSSEVPKWFYYLATRHFLPRFRDIAAHKATTMGHIQRKHLTEARLAIPPAHVLASLSELVAPLFERRIANSLQARYVASLRDTLLPRLISGQLRLPEAEAEALAA
ncbi:HsdS protein [Burkholderia pseudomallei]|nr:HsdS protein [Burkholderia pseudomallei]